MTASIFKFTLFCYVFALSACMQSTKYLERERTKVNQCHDLWTFGDLEKETLLKVLLFDTKFKQAPNLLIGVDINGDTIAVLDKRFDGQLKVGERINVDPSNWTKEDKDIRKPIVSVHKESEKNDLYCVVKKIYYGKIVQLP